MARRPGASVVAWRWFSGHALDGHVRTNATWTMRSRGARPVLHPSGHAVSWHHLPRLHRAGIRTGSTLAVLGIAAASILVRADVAARPGVPDGGRCWLRRVGGVRGGRGRGRGVGTCTGSTRGCAAGGITRGPVALPADRQPLKRTLAAELGGPPARLEIKADRSRVVVGLAEEFTASDRDREAITRVVTAKLALEAPDVDWSKLTGRKPQVTFARSQPPPSKVTWRDIEAAVTRALKPAELHHRASGRKDQMRVGVDRAGFAALRDPAPWDPVAGSPTRRRSG